MVEDTKVERCLREICYSLFVMTHEKEMINVLFAYHGWEHNPIVWAMKKYPSQRTYNFMAFVQSLMLCIAVNQQNIMLLI